MLESLCSRQLPARTIRYQHGDYLIKLKPWDVFDVERLFLMIQKNRQALSRFMPWAHYSMNMTDYIPWAARAYADYFTGNEFLYGIYEEKLNQLIGSISLRPLGPLRGPHGMEIGYWMDVDFYGKGIMTSACQTAIVLGFYCFGLDRVQISCNSMNAASRRVIEKCGFHYEGKARNLYLAPTKNMIENGYDPCRSELLFALTPDDLQALEWIKPRVLSLEFETFFGKRATYGQ